MNECLNIVTINRRQGACTVLKFGKKSDSMTFDMFFTKSYIKDTLTFSDLIFSETSVLFSNADYKF